SGVTLASARYVIIRVNYTQPYVIEGRTNLLPIFRITIAAHQLHPTLKRIQSLWIPEINGVAHHVAIEIRVAAAEEDRITRGPASHGGIVIAGAEAHQPRARIVESTGEAERLEAGIGVQDHAAPGIVVQPLRDLAGGRIDHQARAAELVLDDLVGS